MKKIEEIIKELTPEQQRELQDFAVLLLEKGKRRRGRKLRQDWAGGLRKYRDKFTSLELQKKALWNGGLTSLRD